MPMYELSDLFVVCVPRYEVPGLFVDIFPWLLYFPDFLVWFSEGISTLICLLGVCCMMLGLFYLRVNVPECEVSAEFVSVGVRSLKC